MGAGKLENTISRSHVLSSSYQLSQKYLGRGVPTRINTHQVACGVVRHKPLYCPRMYLHLVQGGVHVQTYVNVRISHNFKTEITLRRKYRGISNAHRYPFREMRGTRDNPLHPNYVWLLLSFPIQILYPIFFPHEALCCKMSAVEETPPPWLGENKQFRLYRASRREQFSRLIPTRPHDPPHARAK